jgi:hypothetical protein
MLNNWDTYKHIVVSLSDNLKHNIYLKLPLAFIPDTMVTNMNFTKIWSKLNINKSFTVVYNTTNIITNNNINNTNKFVYDCCVNFDTNRRNRIVSINSKCNGVATGICVEQYNNGNLKDYYHCKNGASYGIVIIRMDQGLTLPIIVIIICCILLWLITTIMVR